MQNQEFDKLDISGIELPEDPLMVDKIDFAYQHIGCHFIIKAEKQNDLTLIIAYSKTKYDNVKLRNLFDCKYKGKGYKYFVGVSEAEANRIA